MDSFKQIEIDRKATVARTVGYLSSGQITRVEYETRVARINAAHDGLRASLIRQRNGNKLDRAKKAAMPRH